MFLRILKKDLKRKKTMNVILLLFIILSAMFVASSVNNIITVMGALDFYFEKADVPDYFVATKDAKEMALSDSFGEILEIENYKVEKIFYATSDNFFTDNTPLEINNTSIIMNFEDAAMNFFDKENNLVENVQEGTVVVTEKVLRNSDIEIGDIIEIRIEDVSLFLEVAGGCKDAIFGSDTMGMARFILNEKDFLKFQENESISTMYAGSLCYIETENIPAVEEAIGEENGIIFNGDINMIKMTYIMNMLIAGVLLVVSVCLILVAFVVLHFTITFMLTDEFREIGIMKAIGIASIKIRGLYMVKYLMLAIVGTAIGFFASIPFSNLLLQSVSESMVLGNDNMLLLNFICCIIVVVVIIWFSFVCTGRVKKFTPIDAIRSGTTGERLSKKSILRLRKTRMKPTLFMAMNDILSSPKCFATIILEYMICLVLVLILVNATNTLGSGKLINSFGMTQSDVYLSTGNAEIMSFMTTEGREKVNDRMTEIEKTLAENDMSAKCSVEFNFKFNITHGENSFKSTALQGVGTTTDMYKYYNGTAPMKENEIAITPLVSEKLNIDIGDTVIISHSMGEREYIVTALYQSMNNMGEGIRFHETAEIDFAQATGVFAFQIDFDDNPDEETIYKRIERIKEIYDVETVYTAGEYVENIVGGVGMLDSVKMLTLSVVMIIIALVTILMQRSFIAKERNEVAILKVIGFKTGAIIKWYTLRFGIVGIIATFIALILNMPLTELLLTPIFKMMGAVYGVEYEINHIDVFVIYPLIVLAISVICAFLTSIYTKTIKTLQALDIE